MVWKLHCEPVHAVRTVSLGVALGDEVNIMYSQQQHGVKPSAQPLSQTLLPLPLLSVSNILSVLIVEMFSNMQSAFAESSLCNQMQRATFVT